MDSYPNLGVQQAINDTNNSTFITASQAVTQLWLKVIGDTKEAHKFNQAWNFREFSLGDELTQYNCVQSSDAICDVLQIICQGKVRLLAFDASLEKEVSVQLLHGNQVFGGDNAFCNQYREYRAVASSNGTLAQISLEHLDVWLQLYPALFDYFSQISKSRQKLIFFKTLTQLRSGKQPLSQNIPNLEKILPYFLETEIDAGSALTTVSPSDGRFWLVSGEISSIYGKNRPPVVGESWGYPDVIEPDLVSQTDLSLLYLPKQHFDLVVGIIPQLKPAEVVSSEEVNNKEVGIKEDFIAESKNVPQKAPESEFTDEYMQFLNQHPPQRWFGIYPFIQQQGSSDCGAACIAMISRYWGKRFNLKTLRSIAHINSIGAELSVLADAALCLGYKALAVRASLKKLESQVLPWIAHYQGNHYIAVWEIKDKFVIISDPAIGIKRVPRDEFEENFTGYALLLSPTEDFFSKEDEAVSFRRFYQFFENNRFLLLSITVVSILLAFLGLVPAILAQNVIDAVIAAKNLDSINVFTFGFLVFGFGRIAVTAARQHLLDYLSNRLDTALIGDFISHTLELPLSFFASRRVGDILSQIQENNKIHRFLSRQAITTILDSLMTFLSFGLMAYYSWELTLVVISFVLSTMCVLTVGNLFLKQVRRQYSFDFKAQNSLVVEIITGITTIKAEKAENSLRSRWEEYFSKMMKTRSSGQNLANSLQFTSGLINHLGTTVVLWYGTQMVMNLQISIGAFIAFNILISNTINPLLALVKLWDEFPDIVASVEKLDDVLATETEQNTEKSLDVISSISGEVHFENVSFSKRTNINERDLQQENILQNISFCVEPGQTIGIVGTNDSAKEALVNLLSGLYHPRSGRILIDGRDISKISPYSLKNQLSVIPQEFFLFSGTILENITLHNREYSLEQAQTAARIAGADAFIKELPFGYSTVAEEAVIRLDATQKQKLSIARALIKNPRILIIDEANSVVDPIFEYQLQQNLACYHLAFIDTSEKLRTTFIISPSLSSLLKADAILVLDGSILVDQGTHEELMARSKIYPSIIRRRLDI
ncbi:peptidase [Calothrix parasitica NIES-267]|uniref:Peptidase n=1 Tax=Calothrix parasitica NIES-267 TaxID=1973488 RepID=A0A1Z4M0A2_9CYAN|nr:peptidase [Calothrix parasitica NIES-267]